MFCVKCGREIEDNSNFCTFCGNVINNQEKNNNTQVKNINLDNVKGMSFNFFEFLKMTITHPVKSSKTYCQKLSNKLAAIYLGVIAALIAIINLLSINTTLNKYVKLAATLSGSHYSDVKEMQEEINYMIGQVLPKYKIFMFYFLGISVFFLVMISLSYVIFTGIMKKQIKFMEYFKAFLPMMSMNLGLVALAVVLSFVSIILFFIVTISIGFFYVILSYTAIQGIVGEDDKCALILPIIFIIATVILLIFNGKMIFTYAIDAANVLDGII